MGTEEAVALSSRFLFLMRLISFLIFSVSVLRTFQNSSGMFLGKASAYQSAATLQSKVATSLLKY